MRLCRRHRLYTALAYLFPRALLDYAAPVAELTVAIGTAKLPQHHASTDTDKEWPLSKTLAFKLLVYLRTCFAGLSFPPGEIAFTCPRNLRPW